MKIPFLIIGVLCAISIEIGICFSFPAVDKFLTFGIGVFVVVIIYLLACIVDYLQKIAKK